NLLAAGTPVKVLVQLGDLCHNEKDGTASPIPSWTSQIASMVSAMGNVYVSQMTASRPSSIQASMMDGLVYNGPALFSVYCPDSSGEQPLGTYLLAAAAEEARAFPAFTYNPGLGETLADRVNVLQNPQNNRIWPVDKFDYQTETEEQRQLELAFTPADFLLADPRFKDMFWNVSPEYWTEELIALQDYLQLPDEKEDDTPDHIPYVTAVDSNGKVARMVPTRRVLVAVERAAQAWRGLQEMGGIDNSHALALIAEEKQNLEEAMKSEVEAIETKYSAELERDLGDLSQEIIRRIAAQLIAQGQSVPSFAAFPPVTSAGPKPAAPPETAGETAAPAEEKVEEEEEEEAVSFDEPYIDTPLCTSCNDCMKVNAQVFLYNENKQAYLGDLSKATYEQLVRAAEKCPVHIIHPGKPKDPNEPNLDELVARAAKFN
ncbi:MAG: ferredoxin, partial [Candidatus Latescibacterota bacterium]